MCYYADCEETGSWIPTLVLRESENDPGTVVSFDDPKRVSACETHRKILKPGDYLSHEGFSVLERHLRERAQPAPTKKYTRLEWKSKS